MPINIKALHGFKVSASENPARVAIDRCSYSETRCAQVINKKIFMRFMDRWHSL